MDIKKIINIEKKKSLLFYRNDYSGSAVFIYGNNNTEEAVPIQFSIEKTAIGVPKIEVKILRHINYPMLGAVSKLKLFLSSLEKEGRLP